MRVCAAQTSLHILLYTRNNVEPARQTWLASVTMTSHFAPQTLARHSLHDIGCGRLDSSSCKWSKQLMISSAANYSQIDFSFFTNSNIIPIMYNSNIADRVKIESQKLWIIFNRRILKLMLTPDPTSTHICMQVLVNMAEQYFIIISLFDKSFRKW